jgi:uncharacterized protein (TIGR02145 family)/prepilin-type N-terminal cleavage/methylation domain-containing protein
MKKLNHQGFTFIEVLICVSVICIIATFAVISLNNARMKTRDMKRVTDIAQLGTALGLYYIDQGTYPTIITPGQALESPNGSKTYMFNIPSNPLPRADGDCNDTDYRYVIGSNNKTYSICSCLATKSSDLEAGNISYTPKGWSESDNCFTCGDNLSLGGESYPTVQIGTQCLLNKNLNVGTQICNSGTTCTAEPDNNFDYNNIEKYCYENNLSYCSDYGALYTWPEALGLPNDCKDASATNNGDGTYTLPCPTSGSKIVLEKQQGICPRGWHVINFSELQSLAQGLDTNHSCSIDCQGGSCNCNVAGGKLKEVGTTHWNDADGATNESNFTALGAGFRLTFGSNNGKFGSLKMGNFLWTSSPNTSSYPLLSWYGVLSQSDTYFRAYFENRAFSASVRCLKD